MQKYSKKIGWKKKYSLYFGLNQKNLLYKLWRITFVTTCIEGIFDFSKTAGGIYFSGLKKSAASSSNLVHKMVIISAYVDQFRLGLVLFEA